MQRQLQMQRQKRNTGILRCAQNDEQDNYNGNSNSRSPSGMTNKNCHCTGPQQRL